MAKVIGIIEYELLEDDGDTSESLIKEAKKEFNYDIQEKSKIERMELTIKDILKLQTPEW